MSTLNIASSITYLFGLPMLYLFIVNVNFYQVKTLTCVGIDVTPGSEWQFTIPTNGEGEPLNLGSRTQINLVNLHGDESSPNYMGHVFYF